jgi:hypothetical protein
MTCFWLRIAVLHLEHARIAHTDSNSHAQQIRDGSLRVAQFDGYVVSRNDTTSVRGNHPR